MAAVDEPDPYELLQVHPKASPAVIKKAYRALMLELGAHPDAGGDAGFSSQLSAAYALLMDPEKRAAYDQRRGPVGPQETPSVVVPCASCGRRNRVRQLDRLEQARCKACGQALVGPGAKVEGGRAPGGPQAPGAPPVAPQGLGLGAVVGQSFQALWEVGGEALRGVARRLGPQVEAWWGRVAARWGAWEPKRWATPGRVKGALAAAAAMGLLGGVAWWGAQPPSVEASLLAAQQAEAQGDRLRQKGALEAAWRAHEGDARVAEALGRLRLDEGDAEGAIAPLREALLVRADDLRLGTLLGDALRSTGRTDEAELRYRAVLGQSPEHPEARFGLALVLAARGRFAEAVPELKAAASLRPDPVIWHNLGLVLAREGRPREALAAEEEALKLAPERRELRVKALGLALGLGDKAKALTHLQALGGGPADANEAVLIAEAWGRVGRREEAKAAWRVALRQPGLGSEARARALAAIAKP